MKFLKKILFKSDKEEEKENKNSEKNKLEAEQTILLEEEKDTVYDAQVQTEAGDSTAEEEIITIEEKKPELSDHPPIDNKVYADAKPKNSVELKELSKIAIVDFLAPIRYSEAELALIRFHFRHGKDHPLSISGLSVFTQDDYITFLKRNLDQKGIKYRSEIKVELVFASKSFDQFHAVAKDVNVELKTFAETGHAVKGRIKAHNGYLWEDNVLLVPRKKPYYIGRCKMPQLPSGVVIENDIAFIGREEAADSKYDINSNVSRSMASISFDEEKNQFQLSRSALIDNRKMGIRILRLDNYTTIKNIDVESSKVTYSLKDGDQIVFNKKVSILFNIESDE